MRLSRSRRRRLLRAGGRATSDFEKLEAKRFNFGERAIERCLVSATDGEHGVPAAVFGLQARERGADHLAQMAAHDDFVPLPTSTG
ncbi:hypothetical protein [Microlunatus sp. Gsoil 973]|uniref:hypothetical protein n=1 Tax=Microlunatus sp. Gsoil 973 TaxID=2672569 RepID=UPI0012B4F032|nr:hypothetical protein [Microlunatus sp. Gsoil 973]QGN32127.1 hypothetical protein GJV80_04210 [Microlunatus sp. Gsoil 973]